MSNQLEILKSKETLIRALIRTHFEAVVTSNNHLPSVLTERTPVLDSLRSEESDYGTLLSRLRDFMGESSNSNENYIKGMHFDETVTFTLKPRKNYVLATYFLATGIYKKQIDYLEFYNYLLESNKVTSINDLLDSNNKSTYANDLNKLVSDLGLGGVPLNLFKTVTTEDGELFLSLRFGGTNMHTFRFIQYAEGLKQTHADVNSVYVVTFKVIVEDGSLKALETIDVSKESVKLDVVAGIKVVYEEVPYLLGKVVKIVENASKADDGLINLLTKFKTCLPMQLKNITVKETSNELLMERLEESSKTQTEMNWEGVTYNAWFN